MYAAAVGAGKVIAVMRGTGCVMRRDGGSGLGAAAVYGAAQLLITGSFRYPMQGLFLEFIR